MTRRPGFAFFCSVGLTLPWLAGSLGCGGEGPARESAPRTRAQLASTEPGSGVGEAAELGSRAQKTAEPGAELWAPLPSSAQKQEQILQLLERFVPHAESFFRASDLSQPRSDYYQAVGSGVTQPRGAGNIAFAYVTLLEGRPDQQSFAGVPRATLLEHTISSLRHEALTNTLSGAGYSRWGNGSWQASLEAFSWGFAAWRLWPQLDSETRALVERVLSAEADILIDKPIASGEEADTGAEDNAWNATTPALAAAMFPEHPSASAWHQAAIRLALNASSTAADAAASELIDGQPLSSWMASVNLHPDLTLENHGFFNPVYQQVTHVDLGDAALAYRAAELPLPQALSFRVEQIWEQILLPLSTDEGDLAMPSGQDWTSKDYQHLEYLSILATRFQRPEAALLEGRALEQVARRQAQRESGALLGQAQLGYETMLLKRLAAAYWQHRWFGPAPAPAQTRPQLLAGAREYPYSDFVSARLSHAFVSMSWDPARVMGLVIPRAAAHQDDPVFAYYAPGNLLGGASGSVGPHHTTIDQGSEPGGFSSAGSVGARRFALSAFADGLTLLLDRGTGPTFSYSLEDVPGWLGPRPIHSAGGEGLGDLPGSWLNAADRLGMLVRGGGGLRAERVPGDNPTLRLLGSAGTGSGVRGAVLLPLASAALTAELDAFVEQPAMPEAWAALSARAADGSRRVALARWAGYPAARVVLHDERGAPVPAELAQLADSAQGMAAHFTARLAAPRARAQTLRFFVHSASALSAQELAPGELLLRNPSSAHAEVTVTHVDTEGEAVLRCALAGGEQVHVLRGPSGLRLERQRSGLELWLEPTSAAHPGELVQLRGFVRNPAEVASLPDHVQLAAPEGWSPPGADVPALAPGEAHALALALRVPAALASGTFAELNATLSGQNGGESSSGLILAVDPLLELVPSQPLLALASGGHNAVSVRLRNPLASELALTLGVQAPEGVHAELSAASLTLPPCGSAALELTLTAGTLACGSAPLALVAQSASGASLSETVTLLLSDDLARNAASAGWPLITASSAQAAYPAALATDGDDATFWVSEGSSSGQGPTAESPVQLSVELGFPTAIGSVVMRPRPGYGPSAYGIEVSDDGQSWRVVARVPSAPNAAVTTPLESVTARHLRLNITGGHDRIQPPRNVQVAALELRAPGVALSK